MSSTLLKSLKAYKCDVADCYESIYVVITNTAESNVRPLDYHHWAMCSGMRYQVMETLCEIAGDAYNGNIHWRNTWGEMGICSKFMTYAEKVISEAKELTTPIPELYDYPVMYFKPEDPDVAYLQKFAELDKFEIRDFYSQKVLQIKNPTVSDVYWGGQIRRYIDDCRKYAKEAKELDVEKFHRCLREWCGRMPEPYREIFKGTGNFQEPTPQTQPQVKEIAPQQATTEEEGMGW